ncbi:MAG: hypothetical protein WBQ94_27775 [Terracidiphilus sp.]
MMQVDFIGGIPADLTAEMILAQLEVLTRDEIFRSSRRSIAFLKYVVEETLKGSGEQIKERTIGIEVFGRSSSYDTNLDHIVRTAATELRKRLAIYYGDEKHRSELRISLVPGSYIPKFAPASHVGQAPPDAVAPISQLTAPDRAQHAVTEPVAEANHQPGRESGQETVAVQDRPPRPGNGWRLAFFLVVAALAVGSATWYWLGKQSPVYLFWRPVLDTPGPVLLAVGDVPNGPPTPVLADEGQTAPAAIPQSGASGSVPFADAVTIARVVGVLQSNGKKVLIRRENASSFSDLREGPVVLIGAFNNEWSLRLTRRLRYTLAIDGENHLIYIKDAKSPSSRTWSWGTNQSREHIGEAGGPVLHDYALISRIRNSETGNVLIVIGGLYTYGTQSAGEFLTDPQLMSLFAKTTHLNAGAQDLQIVLETTVTDGTPGPPRILAVSQE